MKLDKIRAALDAVDDYVAGSGDHLPTTPMLTAALAELDAVEEVMEVNTITYRCEDAPNAVAKTQAAEREACAGIAEEIALHDRSDVSAALAATEIKRRIRARTKEES